MTTTPEFLRIQYAFAAHIRDPGNAPPPADIEDRRMGIYRELFYNNVESLLSGAFPVLRRIHDASHWHALVRDYFAHHRSRTPLFPEIPREFLHWLEHGREARPGDLPFLHELAHYEWTELALSLADAPPEPDNPDPEGDLLYGIPELSPLAWLLAYQYPVHRISPDFLPDQPGETPTFLVVYRNREDAVGFLEINAVTRRLLELIETNSGASGHELLTRVATELSHPQPEVVISSGTEILQDLRNRDIIHGTRLRQRQRASRPGQPCQHGERT